MSLKQIKIMDPSIPECMVLDLTAHHNRRRNSIELDIDFNNKLLLIGMSRQEVVEFKDFLEDVLVEFDKVDGC